MTAAAARLPREAEHLQGLQRMATLEAYYQWTYGLLRPWIGKRVLDAGCGIGTFSAMLASRAERVIAGDLSEENLSAARARFAGSRAVEVVRLDLEADLSWLAAERLDTVACLDVLEHLDDDAGALRSLARAVGRGGRLVVKVPACPWMFGAVDVASDHRRRYSPGSLRRAAERAGWRVRMLRYMNLAGVGPYFLKSRVLGRGTQFSRTFSPRQLGVIRRVVPLLRALDAMTGPPVGQSLVMAAELA